MTNHKISKNCFRWKAIENPMDLIELTKQHKSVYNENMGIKPASVIISMQFRLVMRLIKNKSLYFVLK
jgi:hypothetical protein